jgi:hypothetical protein
VGLALLFDLLCSVVEMSCPRRQRLEEPDQMLKSILLGSHDSDIVQIQQTGSMISQQYQLANT